MGLKMKYGQEMGRHRAQLKTYIYPPTLILNQKKKEEEGKEKTGRKEGREGGGRELHSNQKYFNYYMSHNMDISNDHLAFEHFVLEKHLFIF